MSISYELSKVKEAFVRVRNDMNFLSGKISENYDEFMRHHRKLAKDVEAISYKFREQVDNMKNSSVLHVSDSNSKDFLDLKSEIKELKSEVIELQRSHYDVEKILSDVKRQGKDVKELKDKLNSSELELFLLKEKIAEKDNEIKQIQDLNKHMYKIVEELSKIELDMLNSSSRTLEGRK